MTHTGWTRHSAVLIAGLGTVTLMAGMAGAQTIHPGDTLIQGSLCVGIDCTNPQAFSFDTIRLRENTVRIKFEDSSSVGGFPTNDWQLTANDSASGGANRFSIDDVDNSRTPFTIIAGARSNSIFVNSSGRIGFGTATPVVDLHVVSGNTPTLRLDQNGSSGFTPQVWDVAGNETNFFIRDATNASKLVFRVQPNAPSNSIFIASNGNIGAGTAAPLWDLHVKDTAAGDDAVLALEANGVTWEITNNAATGRVTWGPTGGVDPFKMSSTAVENLLRVGVTANDRVDIAGNLTLTGSLVTTGGGGACTVGDPCDAVFDPAVYTVPSIADHAAEMWAKGYLPAVGPTGPDQPIDVTVKMLRMLNELEHAHIYIAELHAELGTQNQRIETQNGRIEALERLVSAD